MNVNSELYHCLHITEEDVAQFLDNNVGLYRLDCARLSHLLVAQLTSARKHRTFNILNVTDVINTLEGVSHSGTCFKGAERFKHLPLKGLWKAHFFDARFLMRNLVNQWGLAYETSPKFGELCLGVAEEEEKNPTIHGWQGRLAHKFTIDGYVQRVNNKNLTGEWLIFAKHENLNYHLCVTKHTNSKDGDKAIYTMLKKYCEVQYPFLFSSNV